MHPIPRASALDDLRSPIRRDLETLACPTPAWAEPVAALGGAVALDCVVIGAGEYGLLLGAGLPREAVA